mgnify:CR=1 FL=1
MLFTLWELVILIVVFLVLRWVSRAWMSFASAPERTGWWFKMMRVAGLFLPFANPSKSGYLRHLVLLPFQLLLLIVLFLIYYMTRFVYVDHQMSLMCAKDGGVKIYEQIEITQAEADSISVGQNIGGGMVKKQELKEGMPVYHSEFKEEIIKKTFPQITRIEYTYHRAKDDKLLAKEVWYIREGADMISSSDCPESAIRTKQEQKLYLIK